MQLKLPTQVDIAQKTVLVRVDYNVPTTTAADGSVSIRDDERIQASLETLRFLLENNAKILLLTHFGRPESAQDQRFSTKPLAAHLEKLLSMPVLHLVGRVGEEATTVAITTAPLGSVTMLENIRFDDREEANDPELAQQLAQLADVYINEAFSASHRSHASIVEVAKSMPAFAGFGLAKEVAALRELLENPQKPLVIILGGAKISDKVGAIAHLAKIADIILVGGAVANNFLKAEGLETYKSYIEEKSSDANKQAIDYTDFARQLIAEHKSEKMLLDGYIPVAKILYPIDVVAGKSLTENDAAQTQVIDLIDDEMDSSNNPELLYLDIGPKTTKLYQEIISHAKMVFWNGPMGVWENPLFAQGSKKVAAAVALSDARTIIGGGDTIACVNYFGLEKQYQYVSAAGGAALDFLSGKTLPGIGVLQAEN